MEGIGRGKGRAGSLATGLIGAVLVVGACSGGSTGPSVASTGSSSGKAPRAGTAKGDPVAYSRCMRAHGITKFPDPNSNGGLSIDGNKLGVRMDSPQFKAADAACKSLMPAAPPPNPAQKAKIRAAILKYSKCMRAHGIAKFPDPNSDGNLQVSGIDPASPQVKAADGACKHFMPGGGQGASNETGTEGGS